MLLVTSTPAPSVPAASPSAQEVPAPALGAAIAKQLDKAVAAWRRRYLIFKPLELVVDALRAKVTQQLRDAGVKSFDSKHGTVSLQTKHTTNWEAMVRAVIAPKFVEQLIPEYTTESAPFVRAPTRWSGETKR